MIGNSIPEYVFIRLCTLGLRSITPLSIFYCAYSIADPPSSVAGKLLLSWCAIEGASWLLLYLPRKRALQASANHPPPLDKEERKELYWRCWDKIPSPEYYLSRWFLKARAGDIRRDNVKEFFEWALLNRGSDDAKTTERTVEERREDEEELESYVDGVQTLLGRSIEPGRGAATGLRLTVNEVKMLHRPVIWYLLVMIVDTLTAAYLRYNGFILHRTHLRESLSIFPPRIANFITRSVSPAPGLSYWYRPHTSKTRLPILFIHGIGIGLYPYAQFLTEINKEDPRSLEDGEVGVIAIELMPISFRITNPILGRDEICRQINMILERHGFEKVVLVNHSYGSVITTHLLQEPSTASKIGPILFVDPVTFLLHLPDVAYNFTARPPRHANEHQLHYYACTDMMVAHTLARHFFWSKNIIWKEDLKDRDVTVSLGGRDLIVDTATVGKYLNGVDLKSEDKGWRDGEWSGSGLETLWWPTADHAQVFERKECRRKLADVVRKYTESRVEEEDEELWP